MEFIPEECKQRSSWENIARNDCYDPSIESMEIE